MTAYRALPFYNGQRTYDYRVYGDHETEICRCSTLHAAQKIARALNDQAAQPDQIYVTVEEDRIWGTVLIRAYSSLELGEETIRRKIINAMTRGNEEKSESEYEEESTPDLAFEYNQAHDHQKTVIAQIVDIRRED